MKKGLALLLTMVMLLGLLASCAKTAEHKKDTEETEKTQQTTQTEQPTEGFTLIGRWKTKYGSDDHEIAINGDNTLVLIDGIDTVSFTYVLAGDTITATPKDGGEDGYVFKLVQETLIRYENGEKDGYEYEKIAAANVCEHNYVEVSRKEPSYGIEGSIMLSCTRCYNLESKKIPELPPVQVVQPVSQSEYSAEIIEEPVSYCISKLKQENSEVVKKGKNYYVNVDDCIITINSSSFTIITAHKGLCPIWY